MNLEEWRDIEGYNGDYQISSLGRIKSLKRDSHILSSYKTAKDYHHILLYKNGKKKNYRVHRLVAKAFISNPNNYPVVNHKDENPNNNNVNNLEWCDEVYNTNYGTGIDRRTKKQIKKVYQYDSEMNLLKEWTSATECFRKTGFSNKGISKCCNGIKPSYKGFKWSYEEVAQ